jgi:hypothetical protein
MGKGTYVLLLLCETYHCVYINIFSLYFLFFLVIWMKKSLGNLQYKKLREPKVKDLSK